MSSMYQVSLSELVFEDVNDNYGWGKYGDFRVLIRKKDGYINVTKLCQDGGKEFKSWNRNQYSSELIEEVKSTVRYCTEPVVVIDTVMDGLYSTRGTYAHPDIVPHIASWISPKFAVKVSRIVNDYIVRSYREQIRIKDTRIDELIEETRKQNQMLQEQKEENQKQTLMLQKQHDEIQVLLAQSEHHTRQLDIANENTISVLDKLGAASDRVVPRDRIPVNKQECMYIMHVPGDALPYHVIRAQRRICDMTLQKKQQQNQNTRLVVVYDSHPNPREEFLCFRTRAKGKIIVIGNKFKLRGIREEEMVDLLTQVHEEKMREYLTSVDNLGTDNLDTDNLDTDNLDTDSDRDLENDNKVVYDFSTLMKRSMADLKEMAREQNTKGWSKLKKADLVNWVLSNM